MLSFRLKIFKRGSILMLLKEISAPIFQACQKAKEGSQSLNFNMRNLSQIDWTLRTPLIVTQNTLFQLFRSEFGTNIQIMMLFNRKTKAFLNKCKNFACLQCIYFQWYFKSPLCRLPSLILWLDPPLTENSNNSKQGIMHKLSDWGASKVLYKTSRALRKCILLQHFDQDSLEDRREIQILPPPHAIAIDHKKIPWNMKLEH